MLQGPGLRATAEQAIVRVMNMNGMASAISPEHGKETSEETVGVKCEIDQSSQYTRMDQSRRSGGAGGP
jgi:hypothetical protein